MRSVDISAGIAFLLGGTWVKVVHHGSGGLKVAWERIRWSWVAVIAVLWMFLCPGFLLLPLIVLCILGHLYRADQPQSGWWESVLTGALIGSLVKLALVIAFFQVLSNRPWELLRFGQSGVGRIALFWEGAGILEQVIMRGTARARGQPEGGLDPFTGQPMLYSEQLGAYYSVGPDGVDDGGVLPYDPANGTLSGGDVVSGNHRTQQ